MSNTETVETIEPVAITKEERRIMTRRKAQRKYAQKIRDQLKEAQGTCLTEKQAQYNFNYAQSHKEEQRAYRREYYQKKKLKKINETTSDTS